MSSLQITVRSITDSPTIEYHIRKHFGKLNRIYSKISNCRVVIDVPQNHKHKGKIFSVSLDITIPGKELISRKQSQNLYVAIRDSFAAIEKLLEKHIKRKTICTNKYHISLVDHNIQSKDTSVMMHN
ncbi:MAG TPA: HPF/RaiA family ribosome-associated protein [Candidatus Babeliales bacterium]|nr:HPF/RaiA family ribosome-associated protein [Candidatus Babeliales bacterium]